MNPSPRKQEECHAIATIPGMTNEAGRVGARPALLALGHLLVPWSWAVLCVLWALGAG